MDKLESESIGSQMANCQTVSIDKSNQNAEYVQEIGSISSKNGENSRSTYVEDIPSDKKCDTFNWEDVLYSKFECRSTEQQENKIDMVHFLEENGEKHSTVSVQQPILASNKGRTEQKPRQRKNQNIYCCEHCDKKFGHKQRLAVHRAKLHGVMDTGTSFTCCEICGTVFWSEEALAHHLSRHNTKEHNYHCSYCNRSFTIKSKLDRHERTHTKNYKFKCRFCSKGSVSKNVILFHEAEKHNHVSMGTIFYSCSFCGSNFPTSNELENHESTHRDDPPIKCEHCDKMFKTVRNMRYHLNNHCQNKPKLCERKESKNQEPDDLRKTEKPQIEPLQQKVYLAEKMEVDALLESLATDEIHIKDEITDNDSADRDTVEVDIGDHNYRNDVAVDVKNQMTVSSNPAEGTSKSQLEKLKTHELYHSNEYSIKCENCDTMFKSDRQMKLHLHTCLLVTPNNCASRRSTKRKTIDLNTPSNNLLQEESLEQLTTEHIHIVDESNKHYATLNDLTDRDTVEADVIEQDYRRGATVGDNDHMPAQSNLEKCLPQPLSEVGKQQINLPSPQNNGIKDNNVSNQGLPSTDGKKKWEKKKFSCVDCDQIFVDRQRLNRHRVKVHDTFDKDVSLTRCRCDLCGMVYFNEDALKYHRSTHKKTDEDKFNYPCPYCDRKFKSNYRRKCHEQTHTKNYKFKCRFCDAGAPYKTKILIHEAQKHNVNSEKVVLYPCSTCGKKCTNPFVLAIHETSHSNDLPVKCEQCDIRFKNVVYMKQHLVFEHLNKLRIRKRKGTNEKNTTDLRIAEKSPADSMLHEAWKTDVISKITYKFSSGKTSTLALQKSES